MTGQYSYHTSHIMIGDFNGMVQYGAVLATYKFSKVQNCDKHAVVQYRAGMCRVQSTAQSNAEYKVQSI